MKDFLNLFQPWKGASINKANFVSTALKQPVSLFPNGVVQLLEKNWVKIILLHTDC